MTGGQCGRYQHDGQSRGGEGVVEWRSGRVGRGLARRFSQGLPAFPSLLLFSSSTCVRIPHLYYTITCLFFPPTQVPGSICSGTLPHSQRDFLALRCWLRVTNNHPQHADWRPLNWPPLAAAGFQLAGLQSAEFSPPPAPSVTFRQPPKQVV